MKISPNLSLLFLSLGLFTAVQAKDGRWIDTAGFTGKVSAVFFSASSEGSESRTFAQIFCDG
tara:strand:- start:487 stop:672 length:186 start_codon:yes stop_codon:yes gene_type:complete